MLVQLEKMRSDTRCKWTMLSGINSEEFIDTHLAMLSRVSVQCAWTRSAVILLLF